MGSSKKPKQTINEYYMSIHMGWCYSVDEVQEVICSEKSAWRGLAVSNDGVQVVPIDKRNLFGGPKKEGGLYGDMHILHGRPSQILIPDLATRIGGTPETVPGYRGILSTWFTGPAPREAPPTSDSYFGNLYLQYYPTYLEWLASRFNNVAPARKGFYWTTTAYLRPVWLRVKRAPTSTGFYPEKALIGDGAARAIYFCLDNSGSMAGTRMATLKTAMSAALSGIRIAIASGIRIDIGVTAFTGGGSMSFVNATVDDIDDLNAFVQGFAANSTTDFNAGVTPAVAFFNATVADTAIKKRVMIFITDGEPNAGTDDAAAATAADLLDRETGSFNFRAGTAVDCYGINIDLVDISHTIKLDNTPDDSVPIVTGDDVTGLTNAVNTALYGNGADANPAHIIYECLTNSDWGINLPPSLIDEDAFRLAADILFSEGFGLSLTWSNQSTLELFMDEILQHIDGTYGVNPATGKFYITLIRGGYDPETLPELTPDNCRVVDFQRKSLSETTNEIVVTWTNPINEQEETVPVPDMGNYAAQGQIKSGSSNYYGVRRQDLALRLGQRDVRRGAAPAASMTVEVDRSAWSYKSGDVLKITYPEHQLNGLPVRLQNIDYGRPGDATIRMQLIEDVFELPSNAYIDGGDSEFEDGAEDPSAPAFVQLGTMPYYMVSIELGSEGALGLVSPDVYSLVLVAQDGTDTTRAELLAPEADALGTSSYVNQGDLLMAGHATLTEALPLEVESALGALDDYFGQASPVVGGYAWIGTTPATSELCIVVTADTTLTLQRGVLDTTPKAWPAGTPIWFWDSEIDPYDDEIRGVGQTINYKILTETSRGLLEEAAAPVFSTTLDDRPYRPYRPANVMLNGQAWPLYLEQTLAITWARRNRLMETPTVNAWDDGDITPEVGTTYTASIYRVDTNALLDEVSGVDGTSVSLTPGYTGTVRLELKAVRGGLDSYQSFVHVFDFYETEIRLTEDGEIRITESGTDVRVTEE